MDRSPNALGDQLNGLFSWVSLRSIQSAFLPRALVAFALSNFFLANYAGILGALDMGIWPLQALFLGSTLFLAGYLLVSLGAPSEFRREYRIHLIVEEMVRLHYFESFQARAKMTKVLLGRSQARPAFDLPSSALVFAEDRLHAADATTKDAWVDAAASLYHSDLYLRQYDRPVLRMLSFFLLSIGLLALLLPTVMNALKVVGLA